MALLEIKNLGISFGGLRAVDNFNITIEKGQLYGLIGPNGAGKTTIFNLLTGVYKPNTGTILLDEKNITVEQGQEIGKSGMVYVKVKKEYGNLNVEIEGEAVYVGEIFL